MSTLNVIKQTTEVDKDGNVKFRSRVGRGSGKGVEISAEEFDLFVEFINELKANRSAMATVASEE
jgi:hypothetical protein